MRRCPSRFPYITWPHLTRAWSGDSTSLEQSRQWIYSTGTWRFQSCRNVGIKPRVARQMMSTLTFFRTSLHHRIHLPNGITSFAPICFERVWTVKCPSAANPHLHESLFCCCLKSYNKDSKRCKSSNALPRTGHLHENTVQVSLKLLSIHWSWSRFVNYW